MNTKVEIGNFSASLLGHIALSAGKVVCVPTGVHLFMLIDLVKHVESETGLTQAKVRAALGILLNSADRQGAPLADEVFERIPGARPLAAKVGGELGAATGEIARLIERTPGGRRYVVAEMFRSLHSIGLGHEVIGHILPAISSFLQRNYGLESACNLGDLIQDGKTDTYAATGTIAA